MTNPNLKQNYAQHAVSTPLAHSTATSTTPRSIPSPAVPRSTGKTATTAQSHNVPPRPPMGGAPMTASLSQMSNTSTGSQQGLGVMASSFLGASPSGNLLAFTSPGAALLDIGTPSGLMDAPSTGGHAMNMTLSDLGMPSGKRNEDDERRVKLQTVLSKLLGSEKRRFGRVSDEGVRRVGRWAGFEEGFEFKKEAKEFEGNRTVSLAGKNLIVDVTFKNNLPTDAVITMSTENETILAHMPRAAQVFLADLRPLPGTAAINTKLDRFAANLETLAHLDKLSIVHNPYCIEAITGVYESLCRLFEHEKKAAAALVKANRVERHVMCKRSGRPQMHARGKIGLSLDYWMERSHIYEPSSSAPSDESAMDIDPQKLHEDTDSVYSLEITAEASSPDMYPSLRVSSAWLADRVVKPTEETTDPNDLISGNQSVDWQEPPQTYLTESSEQGPDAMAIDSNNNNNNGIGGQQKLPSARFMAKLHPPLVMSWTVASNILQTVNADPGVYLDPRTYENVLLQKAKSATRSSFAATSDTHVTMPDGSHTAHHNTLSVPKPDYGYVLGEIPFAHPRQIVAILPLLRQWAALGSLLRSTFIPQPDAAHKSSSAPTVQSQKEQKHLSLADLLTPMQLEAPDSQSNALPVNVTLSTSAMAPCVDLVFPSKEGLASVGVGIHSDGQIAVISHNNVWDAANEQEAESKRAKMAKALEVVGDIGVWVEWMRKTYGA